MNNQESRKFPKWLLWVIIGAVALCLIASVLCLALGGLAYFRQTSSDTGNVPEIVAEVENIFKEDTPTPTFTPTATFTPTPTVTPTLGIGSTMENVLDGAEMIYIPVGDFLMGSEAEDADDEEGPEHNVFLDAFWVYQFEVTNSQFAEFVETTGYTTTAEEEGYSRVRVDGSFEDSYGAYWGAPEGVGSSVEAKQDHPVVHVSWYDAQAYCEWVGGRLPTEAEWEKAGRGTDERIYPWGDSAPNSSLANYDSEDTVSVGSYPAGASPFDVMDMAGNVWEWVQDWHDLDYYNASPSSNPQGPSDGTSRVLRGGGHGNTDWRLRVTSRFDHIPEYTGDFLGFRCVVDVTP